MERPFFFVPRARSSIKVKIKYQGNTLQKMAVNGDISFSQTQFLCEISYGLFINSWQTYVHFCPLVGIFQIHTSLIWACWVCYRTTLYHGN